MIPENRIPAHPGEVLLDEFLKPLGVSQSALADKLGIEAQFKTLKTDPTAAPVGLPASGSPLGGGHTAGSW